MALPTNSQSYPVPQGQGAPRNLGQMIANLGKQSDTIGKSTVDPRALAAGIKPSFATVNFKGKTWGIRYRGNTTQLLAYGQQGEILGTIPTIDIVIVKSATAISKSFYIDKYKEGLFAAPDCWSTNGQVPDLGAAKKQSATCKGCKWDAFGSRTGDDGRKGKACSDNKRLAVVPAADLRNEAYGGPMLLKLTPSAFNGLSELEQQLHMQGYAYYGVVMRLNFDHEAAYPKILFTPIRVVTDEEAAVILELQANDIVDRILNEELVEVTADPNQPHETIGTDGVEGAVGATPQVTKPVATAFDPGPLPAFLDRTGVNTAAKPTLTPEQQKIAELEAQLAAAKAPPPPPPPPKLTPEQQKIADLEAQLAAAKSGAAPVVTTKPPRKTRTKPVTPAEGVSTSSNGEAHAAPPAAASTSQGDETDDADAPADLASRIDTLLKPTNT